MLHKRARKLAISTVFLSISAAVAAEPMSFQQTATALYLRESPLADLKDENVQKNISKIEEELASVFPAVLTARGQKRFQIYKSQKPQTLYLKLASASYSKIVDKISESKDEKLDLTETKTRTPSLDRLLDSVGATRIKRDFDYGTIAVEIDPNFNLGLASFKAQNTPDAGILQAWAYGDDPINYRWLVRSELPHSVLYSFTVGWGDCMAGCSHSHREFYEVVGDYGFPRKFAIRRVGEAGDQLTSDSNGTDLFLQK